MPVRKLQHPRPQRHRRALDEAPVGLRARRGGHDRAAVEEVALEEHDVVAAHDGRAELGERAAERVEFVQEARDIGVRCQRQCVFVQKVVVHGFVCDVHVHGIAPPPREGPGGHCRHSDGRRRKGVVGGPGGRLASGVCRVSSGVGHGGPGRVAEEPRLPVQTPRGALHRHVRPERGWRRGRHAQGEDGVGQRARRQAVRHAREGVRGREEEDPRQRVVQPVHR